MYDHLYKIIIFVLFQKHCCVFIKQRFKNSSEIHEETIKKTVLPKISKHVNPDDSTATKKMACFVGCHETKGKTLDSTN